MGHDDLNTRLSSSGLSWLVPRIQRAAVSARRYRPCADSSVSEGGASHKVASSRGLLERRVEHGRPGPTHLTSGVGCLATGALFRQARAVMRIRLGRPAHVPKGPLHASPLPDEKILNPEFDIVSAAFHADPVHTLGQIRATGSPLVRLKMPILGNILLCVTHDACGTMLKDKELFVRDPANAGSRTQERILKVLPRSIGLLALNMLGKDDPEHRHLRGLVDQAFQRRGIEAMRPVIAAVADRLLERFAGRHEVDLMEEFCRDLPLAVICEILGLPDKDHERFKNWLGGLKDTANIVAVIRAIPGVLRVVRYLRRISRAGGGAKPDGLIAALQGAEVEGRRLSEDEIVSMLFLLFGAGQETTTHLISGGLLEILRHDDQRRRLQSDSTLMPLCVEECLRHVSPVQLTKPRWASRAATFAGREFKRGDMIAGFLTAANRDPAVFQTPDQFDISRRPNPHLSFGTGVHFCLGFQLARAETAIAFERVLTRFPDIRLADPANIAWRKRVGIRALSSLRVRLH